MKKCSRCEKTKKLSEFQVRKASKDGMTAACKSCLGRYDHDRSNLPHRVESRYEYAKTAHGKEKINKAKRNWLAKNTIARAAHIALDNAVRGGRVEKLPCLVCGEEAEAHHPDYSRPLDVVWLCSAHHKQTHVMHRRMIKAAIAASLM